MLPLPCCPSRQGELSENILQHLFHYLPPQTVDNLAQASLLLSNLSEPFILMRACFTQSPCVPNTAIDLLPALVFEAPFVVNLSQAAHTYFAQQGHRQTERESATAIMDLLLHASHDMDSSGCANLAWHWGLQLATECSWRYSAQNVV